MSKLAFLSCPTDILLNSQFLPSDWPSESSDDASCHEREVGEAAVRAEIEFYRQLGLLESDPPPVPSLSLHQSPPCKQIPIGIVITLSIVGFIMLILV